MSKRYKVTINKRGHIPGVGHGPIKRPIIVSETVYNNLVKLGFPVEIIKEISPIKPISAPVKEVEVTPEVVNTPKQEEEVVPPVEPEKVEELIKDVKATENVIDNEEVVNAESEIVTTNDEETDTEVEVEEVVVNDKDLSSDAYYTPEFLTSKNMCKKILNARQIAYDSSSSFTILKDLVAQSNPEVDMESSEEE